MSQSVFPYTVVPARLKAFLVQIPRWGTPTKVTTRSLPELGFKSTNDRGIVGVLKTLDLISETGIPTARWQSLRHTGEFAQVLAGCIRVAYPALYETFPDAHKQSDAEITNFMRHRSRAGDRAVQAMTGTFRMLCSLADFEAGPGASISPSVSKMAMPSTLPKVGDESERPGMAPVRAEVTINLQIQLTDSVGADQIDAVFESLARHILWRENDEPLDFEEDELLKNEPLDDEPNESHV